MIDAVWLAPAFVLGLFVGVAGGLGLAIALANLMQLPGHHRDD